MADEIIRLDYSAEDIGDNIDEVREARGEYDSLDERLDEIEGGGPSPSDPIASNCVSPMTGYSKSSSSTPGDINTNDTLNAAIGKLEKRTELNENNIYYNTTWGGGKNKLELIISEIKAMNTSGTWSGNTYTRNGVDFTVNSDSSITVNASSAATALTTFELKINTPTFTTPTTLNGCPRGGDYVSSYALYTTDSNGNTTARDTGAGVDITNKSIAKIRILVRGGYKPTNLIFKPMIYQYGDSTYQPYAMSNAELTNNISMIVDWLNSLNQNLSPVYGGISEANKFIVNNTAITLPAGTYTISWVSAAKTGTTVVSVFNGSDRVVNQNVSNATNDSYTFTIASACDKFNLYTSVANTISNLKIIASS